MKLPETSFDPVLATHALKGIGEAIYWFVSEGPGSERPMSREAHTSLLGLTWSARNLAIQLQGWFDAMTAAGLRPEDFLPDGVKDPQGKYTLN